MVKHLFRKLPKLLLFTAVLLMLVKLSSCEIEDFTTNCDDCLDYWPDSANLVILLTINDENPVVPIEVFRGTVEQQELDWSDSASVETYRLYSKIDQDYSVRATYRQGTKTIIACDADKLYSYIASDECGDNCIIVKGGVLDLRLKE